ncbi:50S ribosome-binding GTPase [Knoellia remsis]|uniref:50S ribosome-binding GTPase n=1 Tax=Knoellia remsis TaxID=407159 RepID=A0A2T0UTV7_9MICO|nr:YfjP family GTPase [Knoellia remsis]PRY61356.1 50S ribosome-binding GTPase [Knoellia remsis]
MSPLRMGRANAPAVSAESLASAASSLGSALESGGAQLPQTQAERARAIITKVGERTALVGGHTVVALAGATGSGKSSLFNALAGADVATVGARRPTTSRPTAAIWGDEPAAPLLDWLDVAARHHVDNTSPREGTIGSLDGLVLLDLPDFDSRETSNREEAERVLELVDVFVWVTDPQKYADARLHDDYVAALATHDAVTLVVLNQVDRLTPQQVEECIADLKRLMARDGMPDAPVIPTSARTGQGLDVLGQRLSNAVAGAGAARSRLAADVRQSAAALSPAVADSEPAINASGEDELVSALARAAGVPVVVGAVERDYRMQAVQHTGWPFTRWVQRLRPKPLRRLRLDDGRGGGIEVSNADVRSVLGRSSLPPPTPAARAAVDLATRQLADKAGSALPVPWSDAVHAAAAPPGADMTDALDQAVISTSLRARNPIWWQVVGIFQVLFALTALAGLLWVLVLMLLGWLQFPSIETPMWGPLPWPFVLLVGGVLAGLLLALVSRFLAGIGARRRGRVMRERLHESITKVAHERILEPVADVLERHRSTRTHLKDAAKV